MTVAISTILRVYGRIGLLSFGGPAAQIALMHKELVEDRGWLTEREFLSALSFCMLLPGPEAMQLATYAGWKTRGVTGGLIAGLLFVVPGAIVIFILALFYASFGSQPIVQAAFLGIKSAIVVIVFQALLKVAAKALHGVVAMTIAAAAFVALFAFQVPFPVIIGLAAALGAVTHPAGSNPLCERPSLPLRAICVGITAWALPFLILSEPLLVDIAQFFSKLAVVTFGGAYAVLAYMTQTVVQDYGWISTEQMMDALGLAETTPGPLILVTQFVAVLAGAGHGGWTMGLAAGCVALWVTFIPCFLWIFAAAPYVDWLTSQPRLKGALGGITAAVVGVIANLSLWFALHLLFQNQTVLRIGPATLLWPEWSSLNLTCLALTGVSAVLLMGLKWPMLRTLATVSLFGLAGALV